MSTPTNSNPASATEVNSPELPLVSPGPGLTFHDGVLAALLGLVTVLLFARSCWMGFVTYDDPAMILDNPVISQGLTWRGFIWAWGFDAPTGYSPLTLLSHMIDVQLFGLNPAGHHATNVLLHGLNASLLFLALVKLTGSRWGSAIVAALFAWHPLRVESVTWVTERKDVLSGLFFMTTLLAYAWYVRGPSMWRYGVVALSLVLGLLSKPMLVTLPGVLLLLDYWPMHRRAEIVNPLRRLGVLLFEKIPLLALVAIECVLTMFAQRAAGAVVKADQLPLDARLGNAIVSYVRYLGKTVWPVDLAVYYPHPGYWPFAVVFASTIALLGVTGLFLWQARQRSYLLMGWLWFLGTLVPVIGIVQVGTQSMADRYTYLATIGPMWAGVWLVSEWVHHAKWRRYVGAIASVAMLAAMSLLSVRQIAVWNDGVTLFKHALAVTEETPTSLDHVATAMMETASRGVQGTRTLSPEERRKLQHDSLGYFSNAVAGKRTPNVKTLVNYSSVLIALDMDALALPRLTEAIHLEPRNAKARTNMGAALVKLNRPAEAIEHVRIAAEIEPNNPQTQLNLGIALLQSGQPQQAIEPLQLALRLQPNDAQTRVNLGIALAQSRRFDEAREQLEQALRLNSELPDALINLGKLDIVRNRPDLAISLFERAIKLRPDSAPAHFAAGDALARLNKLDKALSHFEEALRLRPDWPDAQRNLEKIRAMINVAATQPH